MTAEQFNGDMMALPTYCMAGRARVPADVVQSASALLRHSPKYAGVLLQRLQNWMSRKGFQAIDEVRGGLLAAVDAEGWAAQERADYVSAVREANSGAYGSY